MQYYRCKCGLMTCWGSLPPASCTICKKCGSDLATGPESHSQAEEPHRYITRYDQNTGIAYEMCQRCFGKREELERPVEPEPEPKEPRQHEAYAKLVKQFPHCDQFVLHRPGTCEYCSDPKLASLHLYRLEHNLNYTGEKLPGLLECPAEARRPKLLIDQWGGNRSKTVEVDITTMVSQETVWLCEDHLAAVKLAASGF